MDVDYRKLWKLLIDKGIKNKTDLIKMAGISTNILAKLGKGEFVSMDSMQKICKALDCDVGDVCVINNVEDKWHQNFFLNKKQESK
jgi:DNA-binding Xre family transcriptional regulator